MFKKFGTVGLFATLVAVTWVMCSREPEKKDVIATVGETSLSLDEVLEEIPAEIKSDVTSLDIRGYVQRWVNSEVLYQEAVDRKLDDLPDLQKEFAKVKREIMINKLLELSLNDNVDLSEAEIQGFYETNKESFRLDRDLYHLNYIMLPTREEANSVRNKLRRGVDFESVYNEVKADTVGADWDIGYVYEGEFGVPEIDDVVFRLPSGATSLPIKSDDGYYIVKVVDIQKKGTFNPLANVREEIILKLRTQKRRQLFERLLMQMKSKTKIQTNFKPLEKITPDSLILKGD